MALKSDFKDLIASLKTAGIGPGFPLIPESFTPTIKLDLTFGDKPVAHGNILKTRETKDAPSLSFTSADPAQNYVLVFVDPDAPTREDPKFAYWRHWILPGLQASGAGAVQQSKAALTEYLGPGTKDATTTPHRYIFLLFREPEGFAKLKKADIGGEEFVERRSFKASEFIKENDLELVAVNWFSGVGDDWTG